MEYMVLVNEDFDDVYTKKKYKAGNKVVFSEERIKEIKAVKESLISPLSKVEKKQKEKQDTKKQDAKEKGK